MPSKRVELYEEDGAVMRRVTRDLGGGQRVVTSDTQVHPDISVFVKEQPDARIRGFHPDTDISVPSPESRTLDELPDFLGNIESVDVILRMREMDDRQGSVSMYEERLSELLSGALGEGDEE